jgi:hypothetical protein
MKNSAIPINFVLESDGYREGLNSSYEPEAQGHALGEQNPNRVSVELFVKSQLLFSALLNRVAHRRSNVT